MGRINFSERQENLDRPLVERPGLGAPGSERLVYQIWRAYAGFTLLWFALSGVILLVMLITVPEAGAVALVLAAVAFLILRT